MMRYVKLSSGRLCHTKATDEVRQSVTPDEEILWRCGRTVCGKYWNNLKDKELEEADGEVMCRRCTKEGSL